LAAPRSEALRRVSMGCSPQGKRVCEMQGFGVRRRLLVSSWLIKKLYFE
jgi:hypothetical protein